VHDVGWQHCAGTHSALLVHTAMLLPVLLLAAPPPEPVAAPPAPPLPIAPPAVPVPPPVVPGPLDGEPLPLGEPPPPFVPLAASSPVAQLVAATPSVRTKTPKESRKTDIVHLTRQHSGKSLAAKPP
jgi:hypothetical protein